MICLIDLQGLLGLGRQSEGTVGIGGEVNQLSERTAAIRLEAPGLEIVGFDDPGSLVSALSAGSVDAAVRGTLSSSQVLPILKDAFGLESVMRAALLAGRDAKPFILVPVGIDEGSDMAGRLRLVRAAISYFSSVGWDLSVGVLSKGRLDDVDRGPDIRSSIVEGERMAEALASEGVRARHYSILIEDAARDCDMVVAPDGVSGNLIFRSLCLVGGGSAFGAPVVNLPTVFVDTSRTRRDFTESILLAAGVAERRRSRRGGA